MQLGSKKNNKKQQQCVETFLQLYLEDEGENSSKERLFIMT